MKLDIFVKNIELDNPLRVFVEQKMGDLDRLLKRAGEVEVKVEIGKPSRRHKSGDIYYAEVNLVIGDKLLRAEAKHSDLRAAIVDAKEELKIQIKKFKEKPKAAARGKK